MKKLFTTFVILTTTASVFAQAPEKISYQAVIRDNNNALVTNTQIGMQISILQDSASGTAAYMEMQTPTTNANGLVSIEIGGGTIVSGDFSAVDWSEGPYFIKTETDPSGGTNYTITGTSQLLSVPYALHAKTAESVTGTTTETDPIFAASVAGGITATDTTNWNNKLDGYTETDPIFETSVAGGITITDTTNWNNKQDQLSPGAGIAITNNVVSTTGDTLAIGDHYQGGIIFWLDATGRHGLIAATADQSIGSHWHNGTYRVTGASGDGLYSGVMNTAMIVATQMPDDQVGDFAAKVCADYSVTDAGVAYGDWYLPSKYELNLLYQQQTAVGSFGFGFYWSSGESNNFFAWMQLFSTGFQTIMDKGSNNYVRAIRAF